MLHNWARKQPRICESTLFNKFIALANLNQGAVDCAYGNDPNVPRDPRRPNKNSFSTYSEYNPDEPTGFPFHEPCFQVFAQALRYQLSAEIKGVADLKLIDKDVLYSTMAKLHEEYDHCLKVDYAELNEVAQEQYWYCEPGSEVRDTLAEG
jgi:hypothetical protein